MPRDSVRRGLLRRRRACGRRNRPRYPTNRNRTGRRSFGRCSPRSGGTSPAEAGSEGPPCGQAEPLCLLQFSRTIDVASSAVARRDHRQTDPWVLGYGNAVWERHQFDQRKAPSPRRGLASPLRRQKHRRHPRPGIEPGVSSAERAGTGRSRGTASWSLPAPIHAVSGRYLGPPDESPNVAGRHSSR